ncbi:MAG: peptide synthetase, partial [Kiritimatiellaeota bacterium]|nr:peptide synthetase [Kiritimatiellota bacterium]
FLPQRQKSAAFPAETTFNPTAKLRVQRATIEFVRVILPMTCMIALTSCLMSLVVTLEDEHDWTIGMLIAAFPLFYLAYGALAALFVLVLKWVVIGRYRPVEKPLWNRYVWRSELVTATYENLAVPLFAEPLAGTPFLPMYLRLFGAHIGRRVYMDTTDVTEFDVVTLGDDAALNSDCGPQTHLFEDRVMKISTVLLYDATMENDSALGELSLLMKGETLPAGTHWEGSPARPVTKHETCT